MSWSVKGMHATGAMREQLLQCSSISQSIARRCFPEDKLAFIKLSMQQAGNHGWRWCKTMRLLYLNQTLESL